MVKKYKTLKLLNCFTQVFFEQQYFNPIPLFTWVFLGLLKLETVIPHLKKIQKIYKSRDTPNFCYIKKYRYRLHFDI